MNTKNQITGGVPQVLRILVATDFSHHADNALQWARSLAQALGAKVILLHVVDVFSMAVTGGVRTGLDPLSMLREAAHKCMEELKASIPDAETVVHEASPRPAIVNAALELNCQMIVMGTHGRSGLEHLVLGSVAEYVVRNSKVPVLTVRGS
jgi:nucleotide-binding universal stress UspA family protein